VKAENVSTAVEQELFGALAIEQGWGWSLFSMLAVLYSVVVLSTVIFILIKSARLEENDKKKDLRFPGRVTGERPSERNPG
jgi:hypothetical protein